MNAPMNLPHRAAIPVHRAILQAPGFDNTIALLEEGYRFIGNRCDELGTDIFGTRLMLRRVVCVRGEAAARMFYQPGRFTRRGAIPPSTLGALQGPGSAQTLDGEMHRVRKAMMLALQSPESRARLVALAEREWRIQFGRWPRQGRRVLIQEAQAVLCRAACAWAGVPLANAEEEVLRTAEFSSMIDGAGAVGPRNWMALALRRHTQQWAHDHIAAVRAGRPADPDSPLAVIAFHVDADGEVMSTDDAATELINVLRPVVAVARYIVFGAQALYAYPEWRTRLASGDKAALAMFVEEVRRYYPFFPAVGGRANERFEWQGLEFSKGDWVLLDLYGTNRHPSNWPDGEVFRPDRFESNERGEFESIPQGGGDLALGHRCPGEMVTVELTRSALHLLVTEVDYVVPQQDLAIDLSRMPAMPASGFVIEGVRLG
ncbi:cytochrome P450 [Massilia sp. Mn16-1_5]|uniref:cytochrome P450 n=1 Tax=Massilia sp. Mn16-1_5 TaxID=2079199 RepID=UPI001E54AD7F|nr:cytochrome P450 [Massilia sp. Mn16-1_5]